MPLPRPFARVPLVVQALVGWLPGGLWFFRATLLSGFDKIGGNDGDARLVVALQEHWFAVLHGQVSWTSPPFFHPITGTLGYSDTLFLNQVLYAPLRALGLDEFLAFQWTIILLSVIGFVGMYVLLRRVVGATAWVAFALTTVFVFANNLYVQAEHPQLYGVWWSPIVALLLVGAVRADRPVGQAWRGALAGGLMGLILFSTFYAGWLALLIGGVFTVLLIAAQARVVGWTAMVNAVRRRAAMLIGFGGAFAVAVVPFLVVYLPVAGASVRRYDDVMRLYAPHPREVFDVGADNLLWGSIARRSFLPAELGNVEHTSALTPFLLVLSVVAGVLAWKLRRRSGSEMLASCCLAGSVTVTTLTVLPLRFPFGSLWRIAWTIVPGASAVRAISRVPIALAPLACITVALAIALVMRNAIWTDHRRTTSVALMAVLALLVVEQINVGDNAFIDRPSQLRQQRAIVQPPATCRSFFVVESAPHVATELNVTSLFIAQHVGIPTVNGYSGQNPEGFAMIDPGAVDYLELVDDWTTSQHIRVGLCSYDVDARVWALVG